MRHHGNKICPDERRDRWTSPILSSVEGIKHQEYSNDTQSQLSRASYYQLHKTITPRHLHFHAEWKVFAL